MVRDPVNISSLWIPQSIFTSAWDKRARPTATAVPKGPHPCQGDVGWGRMVAPRPTASESERNLWGSKVQRRSQFPVCNNI